VQTDKIFGDILIGLTIVFTVYLSAGMIHRIHTVTNKDTYRAVLRYEWCIAVVLAALSFGVALTMVPSTHPLIELFTLM